MLSTDKFENFQGLLSLPQIIERRFPNEKPLTRFEEMSREEIYFVEWFYHLYVKPLGRKFVRRKLCLLSDDCAKAWGIFALERMDEVIRIENEDFDERLTDVMDRLKLPKMSQESIIQLFEPYKPFIFYTDYCQFAFNHINSPQYHYFYLLLIVWYDSDYPIDASRRYPYTYATCPKKGFCTFRKKCEYSNRCYHIEAINGRDYDFKEELNSFQRELTLDFLSVAPASLKSKALVRLYESLQQINQSNLYADKLSSSYDKVIYGKKQKPLTGHFYLSWNKVDFFNGFYLIKHPDVPFNKAVPYRVEDKSSRVAFNNINALFLKKLPPLLLEAVDGRIVKVMNKAELDSCITLMEHKVCRPAITKKSQKPVAQIEQKELQPKEAVALCKEFKSPYLNYLCSKQLNTYKVVCAIEHRVNSLGAIQSEYSFLFTIKETEEKLILAFENSTHSRCTYLLPIAHLYWRESIDKIYQFFASNEINKRQQMALGLAELNLPGNYNYQRIYHKDYWQWVKSLQHHSE